MPTYKKEKDYMASMQEAATRGDYASAAMLEAQRNRKIQGEGLDYEQTSQYAQYLPVSKNGVPQGAGADKLSDPAGVGFAGVPGAVTQGQDLQSAAYKQNALAYLQQNLQKPQYQSQYGGQMSQLLSEIMGMEPFNYNAESDAAFRQYKQMYTREGQRAAEDTVGQLAGRTGGMMNSYAASAASQQQQYFAQQIADKIPELEQMAYERYLNEFNMKKSQLGLVQDFEQDEYSRYRDQMGDYNAEREFSYGVGRDQVGDQQWQQEYERYLANDQYNQTADQRDYERQVNNDTYNQTADQRDYERQVSNDQYNQTADQRDFEFKEGATASEMELAWAKYNEDVRAAKAKEQGTLVSDNGTNGTNSGTETSQGQWDQATAEQNLMQSGLSNARSQQDVYNLVVSWLEKNADNLSDEVFMAIAEKYSMVPKEEKDKN